MLDADQPRRPSLQTQRAICRVITSNRFGFNPVAVERPKALVEYGLHISVTF